ncbi:MAG: ribonuclease HII [bacterium]
MGTDVQGLRGLSLAQLRSQLSNAGSVDPSSLEQLTIDPRAGARQLAQRLRQKAQKERRERERLLLFERKLWDAGYTRVAGIDEAGRGPLAGPVVAAAVIFPPGAFVPGVDDSKKVSARKRARLYEEITRMALTVGVGIVDEREIDRTNILAATFKAMRTALGQLSISPQFVLVDGRELPECPYRHRSVIGGDGRCFSIGAASIVAKVTRDRIMVAYDSQFPEYGFAKHKGYATAAHRAALERYGPCALHRRSFSWKRDVQRRNSVSS